MKKLILILTILMAVGSSVALAQITPGHAPEGGVGGGVNLGETPPFVIEIDSGGNRFDASEPIILNVHLTNVSSESTIDNIDYCFAVTPADVNDESIFSVCDTEDHVFSRGGKHLIYSKSIRLHEGEYDVYAIVTETDQFGPYSNGWAKTRIVVTH